jgi:hypothetical protein
MTLNPDELADMAESYTAMLAASPYRRAAGTTP